MNLEVPTFKEVPKTTLVVLGKNIGEDWTAERIRQTHHHLSPHSRVSVLAAGVALKEGLADKVMFTITNTAGSEPLSKEDAEKSRDPKGEGLPLPPEAELMAAQFRRIFPRLANRVSTQTNSWDTNTDAKETRKLVDEDIVSARNGVNLMTVGFHLRRAGLLFRRMRLRPKLFASEKILSHRRPKFVKNYTESELYKKEERKERIVYTIQRLPFAADFISTLTKKSRTR
ncbi:MAG: YdcF family protein [Candidatus Levybacteria bacterium]|nr:YdcF family protein [Candidatus Levybacteria bacterium]